jgi:WD40 repeat protein
MRFSSDGQLLAVSVGDGYTKLFDTSTGAATSMSSSTIVRLAAFSPDGQFLVSEAMGRVFTLRNVTTNDEFSLPYCRGANEVAFSPDSAVLAAAMSDTTIRLYNFTTDTTKSDYEAMFRPIRLLSFSADGSRLASASYAGTVTISDAKTGMTLETWNDQWGNGSTGEVAVLAFSPDSTIAAASGVGAVLLRLTRGEVRRTSTAHSPLVDAAFSPNGRILATTHNDRTVRLWTLDTMTVWRTLDGHLESRTVAFSPDGGLLASGSEGGWVRLWRIESRQACGLLVSRPAAVTHMVFSPDSALLGSASDDKIIRI